MKRENELLLKGANVEMINVLRDFNDTMNATLGDTVTVTSHTGAITRPSTLQDTIDLYQNEWCSTVQLLNEIGIEIESEKYVQKFHSEIYGKLAINDDKEKTFIYNGILLKFNTVTIEECGTGNTLLDFYVNGISGSIASIILYGNKNYEVIESEQGCSLELIEK